MSDFIKVIDITEFNKKFNNKAYEPVEYTMSGKASGVWCLLGEKADSLIVVQVGQSKNIKAEITADIKLLNSKPECVEKDYINQCGKKVFSYIEYPSVRELVYEKIRNDYNNLMFVVIYEADNVKNIKMIESYFAYSSEALFWRNGKPFTNEAIRNIDKIVEDIKKDIALSDIPDSSVKKINKMLELIKA